MDQKKRISHDFNCEFNDAHGQFCNCSAPRRALNDREADEAAERLREHSSKGGENGG